LDTYIVRLGVTTGSCAAAAAKAAALAALGKIVDRVVIPTPIGLRIELEVPYVKTKDHGSGEACVVKDSGDDAPNDATHGIRVCAYVELRDDNKIIIEGGEGIGTVTLPGLPVPVGEKAINPVPRVFIEKAVREALPEGLGAHVRIWVPGGEEIAEKTENSSLGIIGGISIIGTTGVIIPYSSRAWLAATIRHLDVIRSMGIKIAGIASGRNSKNMITSQGVSEKLVVVGGDFIIPIATMASKRGFEKLLIVTKPAKALKLAIGAYSTHKDFVDGRIETLTHITLDLGLSVEIVRRISRSRFVWEALTYLESQGLVEEVLERIACRVDDSLGKRIKNEKTRIGTCIVFRKNILCSPQGNSMLEELKSIKV